MQTTVSRKGGAYKRDYLLLFNYKPPPLLVAKPNQQKGGGGVISSEYGKIQGVLTV